MKGERGCRGWIVGRCARGTSRQGLVKTSAAGQSLSAIHPTLQEGLRFQQVMPPVSHAYHCTSWAGCMTALPEPASLCLAGRRALTPPADTAQAHLARARDKHELVRQLTSAAGLHGEAVGSGCLVALGACIRKGGGAGGKLGWPRAPFEPLLEQRRAQVDFYFNVYPCHGCVQGSANCSIHTSEARWFDTTLCQDSIQPRPPSFFSHPNTQLPSRPTA